MSEAIVSTGQLWSEGGPLGQYNFHYPILPLPITSLAHLFESMSKQPLNLRPSMHS